jgi:hypothetical protein
MTHTHWHSPSVFRWFELCAWALAATGAIAFLTASANVQNTREAVAAYVKEVGRTVSRLNKRSPSPSAAMPLSPERQRTAVEAVPPFGTRSPRQPTTRRGRSDKGRERGTAKNAAEWTRPPVGSADGSGARRE